MEETPPRAVVIAPHVAPVVLPGTSNLSTTERKKLRALEERIGTGIRSFLDVGTALLEIRDARLYRESHTSFEAYCREKWDLERARAYQFMDAAGTIAALPDGSQSLIHNEAQARALAPILRERGVAGVQAVLDQVTERGVPITAPLIRRVANEVAHPNQPAESSMTDRLVRNMGRLATEYRQWVATGPTRKEKTTVKEAATQLIQALG